MNNILSHASTPQKYCGYTKLRIEVLQLPENPAAARLHHVVFVKDTISESITNPNLIKYILLILCLK